MSESKELMKWADKSMYTAEPSEASKGVRAALVSCDPDPLGVVAIGGIAYTGRTIRDTREVTDAERLYFLQEIAKTALKAPLEFVRFVFVMEGVHRGITHQIVRQRTAVFVQESQRFAVKEDTADSVALPPSLRDTLPLEEAVLADLSVRAGLGMYIPERYADEDSDKWFAAHRKNFIRETINKGGPQAWRMRWDQQVADMADAYLGLIDGGMPAEDARGLLPTNILTKIQYSTTLRGFYDTLAMRVSDQAQFEWRELVTAMVVGMRDFGEAHTYDHWEMMGYEVKPDDQIIDRRPDEDGTHDELLVRSSSLWQFRELTHQIKPLDFVLGKRAFGAAFDRASRIAERVDAFAMCGVPSSQWTSGSPEHQIPRISPDEWLLDPASARLKGNEEFDIFGNRVPVGTGAHWDPATRTVRNPDGSFVDLGE